MIKLVDSCSSSQAHYQFNDKLSEELLFDRQSNFFQVRSRRLNDFPLIHLFSCHTSSTTNCSLIICLQTIVLFILHRSRCSLTLIKVWSPRSPGTPREHGRTKSAGSVLCFSLSIFLKLFSDRRQHGALHRVFGHQRNWDYLLDLVQGPFATGT